MPNQTNKRPRIAQVLLTFFLLSMPILYFVQKYNYIHEDLYTAEMRKLSEQIGQPLKRELLWKNNRDENNVSMIYTAYYYPQSLSLVCHTTPMYDQNTPPLAAYLVSEQGTLYEAQIAWDGEFNTTLLTFQNIPQQEISQLLYLDVVPQDQVIRAAAYDPNIRTSKRVRYSLQAV